MESELVRIELKRPFGDGTVAIDLDPLSPSLLCRLAASVPPPRSHPRHDQLCLASAEFCLVPAVRLPSEKAPARGPPFWKSRVLRQKALGPHPQMEIGA